MTTEGEQSMPVRAAAAGLETIISDVTHLAVIRMADWCLVYMADAEGALRCVAAAHEDPENASLAADLARRLSHPADLEGVIAQVVRDRRAEVYPEGDVPAGKRFGPEHPEIVRALDIRSYVCAPLLRDDRVLGAVIFGRNAARQRFRRDDLHYGERLAHWAALLLDSSRLHDQAHSAIRARDEFLSIAAHELRTPVTTLQLGLDSVDQLLETPELQTASGPVGDRIRTLRRQVARLATLVEGLLDVSRISSGRLQLVKETFDLGDVVGEVIEQHRSAARNARSDLRLRSEAVVGFWDRTRIEQAVTNLLSNALKYGAGSPVDVDVEGRDSRAIVRVRDSGIGIAPERIPDVFGRFERAASARAYGGLGLGLYLTRQIVEAHGGRIAVESEPGAGSTFTVELPLGSGSVPEVQP